MAFANTNYNSESNSTFDESTVTHSPLFWDSSVSIDQTDYGFLSHHSKGDNYLQSWKTLPVKEKTEAFPVQSRACADKHKNSRMRKTNSIMLNALAIASLCVYFILRLRTKKGAEDETKTMFDIDDNDNDDDNNEEEKVEEDDKDDNDNDNDNYDNDDDDDKSKEGMEAENNEQASAMANLVKLVKELMDESPHIETQAMLNKSGGISAQRARPSRVMSKNARISGSLIILTYLYCIVKQSTQLLEGDKTKSADRIREQASILMKLFEDHGLRESPGGLISRSHRSTGARNMKKLV